jgi:C4-dicarboxylate transporter DctQ subunit
LPHHDHGHVDGLEEAAAQVDIDVYALDDNLHMHDLKHDMMGERREGADRRKDAAAVAEEKRQAERRADKSAEGEGQ